MVAKVRRWSKWDSLVAEVGLWQKWGTIDERGLMKRATTKSQYTRMYKKSYHLSKMKFPVPILPVPILPIPILTGSNSSDTHSASPYSSGHAFSGPHFVDCSFPRLYCSGTQSPDVPIPSVPILLDLFLWATCFHYLFFSTNFPQCYLSQSPFLQSILSGNHFAGTHSSGPHYK